MLHVCATVLDAEQLTFSTALLKAIISMQSHLSHPYADPQFYKHLFSKWDQYTNINLLLTDL